MFDELRRRNVHRVAVAYLAGAWLLIQVVETLLPAFDWPGQVLRIVLILLAVGFIPALILAWVFEWTPEGFQRETDISAEAPRSDSRIFDRLITMMLVLAVAYFAVDKFVLDPVRDAAREQAVADRARSETLVESYADRSIVVLPFINMSSDPNNQYFSDGITEELLNLLAKVRALRVISRSSSFSFKDKSLTASDVAEQLNVTYVLEGSVRKAGPVVRITAQLIDGRTDTHVWSETYDREFELSEVLQVQDEVAQLVVDELTLDLVEHDTDLVDPGAYDAGLQVKYLLDLYDQEKVEHIEALIEQGLSTDPDYVPLLLQKARLTSLKSYWGLISKEESQRTRAGILDRIRVLDPDNVQLLIGAATRQDDWLEVARLISEAYKKAPTDVDVVESVARFARALGQFDVAIALGTYLVDRDPRCGRCFFRLGLTYLGAQQFDKAIVALEKADLLGVGSLDPQAGLSYAYLYMGKPDIALQTFSGVTDENQRSLGMLLAYYDLGNSEKFEELYATVWDSADWDSRAMIAAWTRDADAAFANLEQGYVENPESMITLFSDTSFMRIWDDPRWDNLMQRLGTSEEDLARIILDIEPIE